jgi:serine/threonine-protein kinase
MAEPTTAIALRERFFSELHRGVVVDFASFVKLLSLKSLSDEVAEDLFLVQIEYALKRDEPIFEAQLIDSLPQYRASAGAAFLTAKLKHTRFAHCFIPDPRKTVVAGGEIFLRSTNVLPPDQFLDPESFGDSSLLPELHLRVTKGPHEGREEVYSGAVSVVIGRALDAQFSLSKDAKCSRLHCRIDFRPPICEILDLNSTNGTFVNGEQIEKCRLVDKDSIQIGNSKFHVYLGAPKERTSQPSPPVTSAPRQIAEFTIESQLGEGSFGTVYAASRANSDRKFALKLLSKMSLDSPVHVESFVREASISTKLKHENIVETLDFGIFDQSPYLVQELVPSVEIFGVLSGMSESEKIIIVRDLMLEILAGLEFAHQNEVLHRDIKPSNLLFFPRGSGYSAKLADFGLSTRTGAEQRADSKLVGTVAYMAPEVLLDPKHSSRACDIYAAGVCLYELLCGKRPYASAKLSRLVFMILNEPPTPIRDRISDIPDSLEQVITRSMSRRPEDRFCSAAEFAQALGHVSDPA